MPLAGSLDIRSLLDGAPEVVLDDRELALHLAEHGLRTIRARHTCAHRVDELLAIAAELEPAEAAA